MSSSTMTSSSLQANLNPLFERLEGLQMILVTSKMSGSAKPLLKLYNKRLDTSTKDSLFNNSLCSTFASENDEAKRLNIGANKTIISFFDKHIILQSASQKFLTTFIAKNGTNIQLLLDLAPQVAQVASSIKIKDTDADE